MFHGRRWRNLSGSNTSMLVISVNTFLKYFSGSDFKPSIYLMFKAYQDIGGL